MSRVGASVSAAPVFDIFIFRCFSIKPRKLVFLKHNTVPKSYFAPLCDHSKVILIHMALVNETIHHHHSFVIVSEKS